MKFRNYAAIVGLTVSVAALSTGCATKTSLLQTETQDHTVTVLATCGAGLDDSISAKAKAQLGQGGEISAEALSSVKASLVNDGTLKSEDKLKAFDIFTKCALEMDKRIRDGKPANAVVSSLVGKQWYLRHARYENVVVDQTKEPPYSVKRTAHDVRSDEVRTEEQPISDAYWIRFREDGMVETNFTNRNINADVLFGHGCANRWTALNDGAAVWVQNGWIFPPEPSEEAKFKVTMNGKKLVLERLEGSHQVLVDGDFQAD
jgi:hypothetical protein